MTFRSPALLLLLTCGLLPRPAFATRSAELYTTSHYHYGRVEARVRFAAGDGVISSFFSWKDGSEIKGTFWNELDFEKLGADCHLETNPIYGNPSAIHPKRHTLAFDLCGGFHTYAYDWSAEAIVWYVDGVEIRRETGATAAAFATNAPEGMQIHFNVWPGDASFGGNFSPSILPVHQYVDWVQFSAHEGGQLVQKWREDFNGAAVPDGWQTGSWGSPKNLSTHDPLNVNFIDGYAVLSLTADNAVGPTGAMPGAGNETGGTSGNAGAGPAGGTSTAGTGSTGTGGSPSSAGSPTSAGAGGLIGAAPVATGCSVGKSTSSRGLLALLGLAGLSTFLRRFKQPRATRSC